MAKYEVLLLLCLFYGNHCLSRVDPLVESNVGPIRGLTSADGTYSMFLGIPYARVDPENPFGPSIPHPRFEQVFEAVDDSAVCPQSTELGSTITGTLDCLNLHISVSNNASSSNLLPVMVWIHGGSFQTEFGGRVTHGPRFLVRHDVIVIYVTYRLGPYGFLCLDIPEVPGNQGLKDQLSAIRWIKNNIEAFGGDTNKITIFGESGGAISVDFHLIYAENGLFNNVIMQSGNALTPYSILNPDPTAPLKLAEYLGFETNNVHDALNFLRTIDTDVIITSSFAINLQSMPCIEKEFDDIEGFITDYPVNMNVTNKVPILIGVNNNEGGLYYANLDPEMYKRFNAFDVLSDHFDFEGEYDTTMKRVVRRFYIGDEEMNEDVKSKLTDFRSDINFSYSSYRTVDKNKENGTIYFYVFSYDGDRNYVKRRDNLTNVSGAVHADELSYLFEVAFINETPTVEDQLIIDRMTTMWTNFAKYSNPTPEASSTLLVQWPAITEGAFYYLVIDSELSVQKRPFHDRMAFLDVFYSMNRAYLRGLQEN